MVQDYKINLIKRTMSKEFQTKSSSQNFTKGDNIIFQSIQKKTMMADSIVQSKQFQTNKKLVLANGTSSHIFSSQSQYKPYSKEMLFFHTINNYNIETSKSRWRKIPTFNGINDQLQNASKTACKLLQSSKNEKSIFNISLDVHSPKQTSSKESYAHDIYESYGSYSAPSTPYNHNSKYGSYYSTKELSNSYHETLFEPSYTKCHINYGVTSSSHGINTQLNHEDNLPQNKWKRTQQSFYDCERKRFKKYGVEKEQIISTIPLQKWVPMDKNSSLKNESGKIMNKSLISQSDKLNSNEDYVSGEKGENIDSILNVNVVNCHLDITKHDTISSEYETNIMKKDLNSNNLVLDKAKDLSTSKSLYKLYLDVTEDDLKEKNFKKETTKSDSNLHIEKDIVTNQKMILTNGVALFGSNFFSSHDNSSNNDSISLQLNVQNCKLQIESIDAIAQHVANVIPNVIHCSIKAREASQNFAISTGTPLAEIERLLFAVAPKFNPISTFPISNDWIESNNFCSCNYSSSLSGFKEKDLCSCHLVVPLSSIWQWYEKPSNYGLEVQAFDSFCNESKPHTYFAYFLPYLSGIQIYGYKRLSPCINGGCISWEIFDPYVDAFEKKDQDNEKVYATSAQLLFEFFDSDPPFQRQPLFQKINDLLQGEANSNYQSASDVSCLGGILLKDLHPASWFAVAWYPIYRISVGALKSVFLTYHSFHHIAQSSTLQCLLGQTSSHFDGNLAFPVIGLESYNTQGENWMTIDASLQLQNVEKKNEDNQLMDQAEILNQRLDSLQMTATTFSRKMLSNLKHSDYEFFVTRRH